MLRRLEIVKKFLGFYFLNELLLVVTYRLFYLEISPIELACHFNPAIPRSRSEIKSPTSGHKLAFPFYGEILHLGFRLTS